MSPHDTPDRINQLYRCHNTAAWAKQQLRLLQEMAESRKIPAWLTEELHRIRNGIRLIETSST